MRKKENRKSLSQELKTTSSTVWATCAVSCQQCTWAWTIMMAPLTSRGQTEKLLFLLFLFRRIVIKATDKSVEGHEKSEVQRDGRFWCGPTGPSHSELLRNTWTCLALLLFRLGMLSKPSQREYNFQVFLKKNYCKQSQCSLHCVNTWSF